MSVLAVTNKAYPIEQGKTVVITNAGTVTVQVKYNDGTAWNTLTAATTDGSYRISWFKEASFRVSAQTAETRFDYSPYS